MSEGCRKASIPITNMEQPACNEQVAADGAAKVDSLCRLHVHSRRHKLADSDGISAKAAIDGLVYAGILTDDSPEQVESVTFSQEKIGKKEIEETIITITTVDAA